VIRALILAALWFSPAAVRGSPDPDQAGHRAQKAHRPHHDFDVDIDLPDFPALPGFPGMDFSELEAVMPQLLARSGSRHHDPDDEDVDEDEERDPSGDMETEDDRGSKVKIYKLDKQRAFRMPRMNLGADDESGSDEREATAQAKGRGSAILQVKGPVTFQVRAQAGDVEVVATDKRQVAVTVTEAPAEDIALYAFGDRVEPSFRGRRTLRRGKLHVELPRGSRLDLSSMSGDVSVQRIGDVRIRSMSGDVKLSGVAKVDLQTISGDARIEDVSGPVRLHTVSGTAAVTTSSPAPQVEFQSASGSLSWAGVCGRDCHISAETVSGDLTLNLDPRSSFELSYTSHSGELRDELNLAVKRAPKRKHGMTSGWLEATFGKGEGVIEADAFSGSLVVKRK
jgi:hypothetical protein